MNKEPDIIISIGGSHQGKGIVAAVIANALKQAKVENVNHLGYDDYTFKQMQTAVNEADEQSNLSTATVLIVEFEEDFIDTTYDQTPEIEKLETQENTTDEQ